MIAKVRKWISGMRKAEREKERQNCTLRNSSFWRSQRELAYRQEGSKTAWYEESKRGKPSGRAQWLTEQVRPTQETSHQT